MTAGLGYDQHVDPVERPLLPLSRQPMTSHSDVMKRTSENNGVVQGRLMISSATG